MFTLFVAALEVVDGGGDKVNVPTLVVLSPFLLVLLIFALIVAYFFLKKRLEHRQIMAAIEKGTPLSELRPAKPTGPTWIRSVTIGIALLLASLPFLYMFLESLIRRGYTNEGGLFPFGILFAIGIAFFIRGLLQRKTEKAQNQLPRATNSQAD